MTMTLAKTTNSQLSTLHSSLSPVPAGYKRTEVGVIPEDWEVIPISRFASIKTGPFGTLLKASEYSPNGGVPVVSVGEIREGYLRISEETPRVCETVTKRLAQYLFRQGDIVFGRKGGVDRSALISEAEAGWFLGSDGISIRPSSMVHAPFVARQFQGTRVKEWLLQHAIGTTMPSLNQSILKKVIIPLPPTKAEQEAIAEALSDADAWIASLEQLIAKKRLIKQGAMQELLTPPQGSGQAGKRRLPGFSGKWEERRLGEIGIFKGGSAFPIRYQGDKSGEFPFYKVSDMNNIGNEIFLGMANNYISEATRKALGATIFPKGAIVFAKVGAAVFLERKKILSAPSCLDNNMMGIILDENFADPRFICYFLLTFKLGSLVSTTALPSLSKSVLKNVPINLPATITEQTAIATVLSDMDADIESLETKLAKARQIKQGMMQELLTGRRRLI